MRTAPAAARRCAAARPDGRSERTRARLLEAAGQLFAEQGVDRVRGQQICARAGVHSAAIVYHFGGMHGLQRAVLAEAQRRLLDGSAPAAVAAAGSDPRRRLEAFIGRTVARLVGPASQSWAARLFSRELVAPSAIYGRVHDRILAERATLLRGIVAMLLGLRPEDPAVARACIGVMAPCAVLLLVNRHQLSLLQPELALTPEAAPRLTRELVQFALGGLSALARPSGRDRQRRSRSRAAL